MSISDDDFEKLIGLVEANRARLERLRIELQQFKWLQELKGLRTTSLLRTGRLERDHGLAPPSTAGDSVVL